MIGLGDIMTLGKSALGLAQGSWVKIAVVAAMVASLIAWDTWRQSQAYEHGVADTLVEVNKANEKARKAQAEIDAAALVAIAKQLKTATDKAATEREKARLLQEQLDKPPEVTPNDIIEATSDPDCARMCLDTFGVWRDLTDAPVGIPRRNP